LGWAEISTEKEARMDSASDKVREVAVADEFRVCPGCEYQRGFHVSFVKPGKKTDALSLVLICPGCGSRFDIAKSI
jgi:hypothetical protein